jgi:hypothetical protein
MVCSVMPKRVEVGGLKSERRDDTWGTHLQDQGMDVGDLRILVQNTQVPLARHFMLLGPVLDGAS